MLISAKISETGRFLKICCWLFPFWDNEGTCMHIGISFCEIYSAYDNMCRPENKEVEMPIFCAEWHWAAVVLLRQSEG